MKHTKGILALLLALALAFGLSLPALAAVNWDDFYIITQAQDLYVKHGESFTLSVEVNIPDGIDRVTYQWCREYTNRIEGATEATLQLSPGDPDYPQSSFFDYVNTNYSPGPGGSHRAYYYCLITAYPEDSAIQPITREYRYATVMVEGSFGRKLFSLTLEPFVYVFKVCMDIFFFVGPFGFIYYPFWLIERYIASFKAVLS